MALTYWWAKPYAALPSATGGFSGHGTLTAWFQREAVFTLSGHGGLAVTARPKFTRATTVTGHGALTAAARMYSQREPAALAGHGVLAGLGSIREITAGHGALAATAYARLPATGHTAGAGVLAAPAAAKITGGLAGAGVLHGAAYARFARAGAQTGHGALTMSGGAGAAGVLPGHGALAAVMGAKVPAALAGHGDLLAAARLYAINRSAGLSGAGALVAAARMYSLTRSAGLTGAGVLAASRFVRWQRSVSLTGQGVLAGPRYPKFARTPALAGHGVLAATAEASSVPVFTRAAALTGHGVLAATAIKAVAFNVKGNGTNNNGNQTWTFTHVAAAGDYVIVDVNPGGLAGTDTITAITYGGAAMTLLGSSPHANDTNNNKLWRYGIRDSTGGSKTVSLTFSAGKIDIAANSVSYKNVGSVGATTAAYVAAGTATISQAVTCTPGQMIVWGVGTQTAGVNSGTLNTPTGGTNRWRDNGVSEATAAINDSPASTTFSATLPNPGGVNMSSLATILIPA